MCSALSKNDTLTSLFLDGNPIGAARFARLQLLSTSKLEVLSLSRIRLGNSLEPLAELLQRTNTGEAVITHQAYLLGFWRIRSGFSHVELHIKHCADLAVIHALVPCFVLRVVVLF